MHRIFRYVWQFAILWFICWICNEFADFADLPIPGNVIGVCLLYLLLTLGVVKVEHVKEGSDFLLKHLVFFFIPITVELMNWGHLFLDYGIELAVVLIITALIPLWAVGHLTQYQLKRMKRCNN
jgi:holin-like protein